MIRRQVRHLMRTQLPALETAALTAVMETLRQPASGCCRRATSMR